MRVFTLASGGKAVTGEIIFQWPSSKSKFVFLMAICVSSPTLQLVPIRMSYFAFRILLHAKEPVVLLDASRIFPVGKNLALNTLKNRESLLCINLQYCLARRAMLNFWSSLNPNPPLPFGWHNFSHLSQ